MAQYNNTLWNEDGSEVAAVLQRDIPWDTYMSARLITDKDLQLIRKYDKRSDDQRSSLLEGVRDRLPSKCRSSTMG